MLAGLLENGPSIGKVADIWAACKKLMPMSRVETPDSQLQLELERLALSAPHMLADIGFERDPRACTSEKTVWRRGNYCVIISSKPLAAAASI
jgi:hypothetical protein